MALPSGYTKLDYIESSGTQYINTGFKPKGSSKVNIEFKMVNQSSAQQAIFGARPGTSACFTVFTGSSVSSLQVDYNVQQSLADVGTPISGLNLNTKTTLSVSSTLAVNGETIKTVSAATFTSTYNLYLFANNNVGAVQLPSAMILYSCKIYDNGTLVRDFIPCKNANGTLGLWDNVNSVFYANAGTGTFSTGTKHKTLIDGTGYEIKSGRALIAGTGYDIKKGRTLIGGTGYDVKLGTPVGELAVGTSVFIDFSGTRREFIVVNQGNPDTTKYDASCNGTWLWQKYAYEPRDWNYVHYDYSFRVSGIYTWLNEDYLNMIDSGIATLIKTVKIPDQYYNGSTWQYTTGANGLETKAFLPSFSELGMTSVRDRYNSWNITQQIGSKLNYFSNKGAVTTVYDTFADCKVFDVNGNAVEWFVRQVPGQNQWSDITYIQSNGSVGFKTNTSSSSGTLKLYTAYICPLLILPSDAKIDDNFNIVAA